MDENPFSSPQTVEPSPEEAAPRLSRAFLGISIGTSLVLIVAAWGLAHHAVGSYTAASGNILVRGALPWLLQWAAIAVLAVTVVRRRFRFDWGPVFLALLIPCLVGVAWWIGLSALVWNMDPAEAMVRLLMIAWSVELGSGSLIEYLIFKFLGPLVCPLSLNGPSMQGNGFLVAGLSTAIVTGYLLWAGLWCNVTTRFWEVPSRRELIRSLLTISIYLLPTMLRLALDLIAVLFEE